MRSVLKDKRGLSGGVVSSIIFGVMGLFIGVIVALIVVQTLSTSNLLGTATLEANATTNLRQNITAGVGELSSKIPTVFLVGAIVLIISVLLIVVLVYRKMNSGSGGGNL